MNMLNEEEIFVENDPKEVERVMIVLSDCLENSYAYNTDALTACCNMTSLLAHHCGVDRDQLIGYIIETYEIHKEKLKDYDY